MPRHGIRFGLGGFVQLGAIGDAARGAPGQRDQVVDIGDVPVRIGRALTAGDADARTLVYAADRIFNASVVEDELQRFVPFPVELRPVPAPRERGAERMCRVARADRRLSRQCGGDVLTSAP